MNRANSLFTLALISLMSMAASAQGQETGLARIYLVNDWNSRATYVLNGRSYSVCPGEQLPVDVAAGSVSLEIRGDQVGVIQPSKTLTLDHGQVITVRVHRTYLSESTSL